MKNLIPVFLLTSLLLSFELQASPGSFTAKIFAISADASKDAPLYTMKHEETLENGVLKFHNSYNYPDGKEAVLEDVELKGTDVVSYHYTQKQLGAEGKISVNNNKIFFEYKRKNEDPKTSQEKYVDNLVIGPSLVPYMKKNWDKLKAGEKLAVRLAVPDRRETLGFDLFKDKSSNDQKTVIKMKASNFVISAVVDPLYFTFTPDGSQMFEMKGRTQPKKEHEGQFSDLDAHTFYKTE